MILENQYIKDEEVAEALNVTPDTLAKWRMKNNNGPKLPYVKIGRSIMYRREAIEKWLRENERIDTNTT
ncbi:helix-turn-helix domain-containing protein [Campylobacter sp. Marseille-Q3452]|uniref:Helix-turn-helix domain-containing protein n=1 Tax=Campylobacter massiliensis TaxID=2762557 RepID=A0A842JDX8_9BACT|nr:helix-turn-helix domain-containing protein [Campylobacter massiliensis]MBC2883573.1 helix-turn-helix domain-containing protein [Campylobacter massiliensis]